MPLSKRDKDFRLQKVNYLDFQFIEMDRVLTNFFGRVQFNGLTPRVQRKRSLEVAAFVDQIIQDREGFEGFERFPTATHRWVETHLLDMVNRGRANATVAAPRPLHGYTYRFRNVLHSRDYGAAQHIYEAIYAARRDAGQAVIDQLKRFFFQGFDPLTGTAATAAHMDVETQALLSFSVHVKDTADERFPRDCFPPTCIGGADLLTEDVQRLLCYSPFVPRSVMVEYLKVLLSFHLAIYHLKLIKLVPRLVRGAKADPTCHPRRCPMNPRVDKDPQGDCPYKVAIVLDVAGNPNSPVSSLAIRSFDAHLRRITPFVKSYFSLRKLDEFSEDLRKLGKLHPSDGKTASLAELLALLGEAYQSERERYFEYRMISLARDCTDDAGELEPELRRAQEMKLSAFDTYIEVLMKFRGEYHRAQLTSWLDSLLLKNRPGALVAQQRTKGAPRRFILDSRLLEVLLQVIVLRPGGVRGYHTANLRVDEVLDALRERYGLYIDRLPDGDGFAGSTIAERRALRSNREAFVGRLREVGYFRDLSDAYVAQTVTPTDHAHAGGAAQ